MPPTAPAFRVYASRFAMLLLYFLVVFVCGMFQNTIAPVQHLLKRIFDSTDMALNMYALVFPLVNVVLSFYTVSFYSRFSLRRGVVVGSALLLFSGWLRYLGAGLDALEATTPDTACWVMFLGQAVAAVAMPFLLAAAPQLSNAWYSEDTRSLATAVGGLASIIGSVAASILAPGLLAAPATNTTTGGGGVATVNETGGDVGLPEQQQLLRASLQALMLVEASMATVPCVAIFLFFKSRPPTPPSVAAKAAEAGEEARSAATAFAPAAAAAEDHVVGDDSDGLHNPPSGRRGSVPTTVLGTVRSLCGLLRESLSNPQFLLLMVAFGCGYGAINTLTTVINQILQPLNYSDDEIGNIGAALGVGVVGSFLFGALADHTKRFKSILRFCAVITAAGFLWLSLELYAGTPGADHRPWVLFGALAMIGFFGVPLVPLLLELGVETLFPLPEAVVGSLLWLAGNLVGLIATLVGSAMQRCGTLDPARPGDCTNPDAMLHTVWLLGAILAVGCIAALGFTGEMRRLRAGLAAGGGDEMLAAGRLDDRALLKYSPA